MSTIAPRRFVIVVPPSGMAGIGDSLRKAFYRPEQGKMEQVFARLIERLDQVG
jgi:hypothetical protein